MKTDPKNPISTEEREIVLRVRELMVDRGIRNASELHRQLIANNVEISHAQLLRIIDNRIEKLNIHVINGLMSLFNCSVHDLIDDRVRTKTS